MTINEQIYKIHIKKLKNLDFPNKKLIISFSAVPGSGKTTIAKKIETKYKGIRIRSDSVRDIINNLMSANKYSRLKQREIVINYHLYLLNKLRTLPNGLIILDSSIDRKFAQVKELADKNKYDLFIIKINVSRKTIEHRIKKRNPKGYQNFLDNMDQWFDDNIKFNNKYKVDFEIDNEEKMDLKLLFNKLNKIIKT